VVFNVLLSKANFFRAIGGFCSAQHRQELNISRRVFQTPHESRLAGFVLSPYDREVAAVNNDYGVEVWPLARSYPTMNSWHIATACGCGCPIAR